MGDEDKVVIKFVSDGMHAIAQGFAQLNAHLESLANKGQVAGQKMDFLHRAGQDAASFALSLTGVGSVTQALSTAMSVANKEWDNFIQRGKAAAAMQSSFGDAARRVGFALSPEQGDMSLDNIIKRVQSGTQRTGGATKVMNALEGVLSSKGSLSVEQALEAVLRSNAMRPDLDASGLSSLAQGVMSMQKGVPGTGSEQALAFIRNTMIADRTTDIQTFTKFGLPSMMLARSHFPEGDKNVADIASFQIGLQQRADDPSGRRTANATQNFIKQFRTELIKSGMPRDATWQQMQEYAFNTQKGTNVRNKLLGPFGGMSPEDLAKDDGAQERLARMFGDKMGLHSEARLFVPLMEYLQGGDTKTRQEMDAARKRILEPSDQASVANFQQALADINEHPSQVVPGLGRAIQGATENITIPNTRRGAMGQLRTMIPDLLQQSGVSKTVSDAVMARLDLTSANAGTAGQVIEAGVQAVGSGIVDPNENIIVGGASGFPGGAGRVRKRGASSEELETNSALRELITAIREFGANLSKKQQVDLKDGDGVRRRAELGADNAGQ